MNSTPSSAPRAPVDSVAALTARPPPAVSPAAQKSASPSPPPQSTTTQTPNSTVVLKNLPFDLDPSALDRVLDAPDTPLRYKSMHLHMDDQGRFRGIAFLNFYHVHEAISAHALFLDREFHGRRVRVEYRHTRNNRDNHSTPHPPPPPPATTSDPTAPSPDPSAPPLDKRREFFAQRSLQRERESGLPAFPYQSAPSGPHGSPSSSPPPPPPPTTAAAAQESAQSAPPASASGGDGAAPGAPPQEHGPHPASKQALRERFERIVGAFAAGKPLPTDGVPRPDPEAMDYAFPAFLNNRERAIVHQIAHEYQLGHRSVPTGDGARQLMLTRDPAKTAAWREASPKNSGGDDGEERQGTAKVVIRKKPPPPVDVEGIKWFTPRAQRKAAAAAGAAGKPGNPNAEGAGAGGATEGAGGSGSAGVAGAEGGAAEAATGRGAANCAAGKGDRQGGVNEALLKALGDVVYTPPRPAPKGPDGTRGFIRRIAAHALARTNSSANLNEDPSSQDVGDEAQPSPAELPASSSVSSALTEKASKAIPEWEAVSPKLVQSEGEGVES